MAITIAIIIVGTISGTIRRAPFTGVAIVLSIITRGQPSALSMTVAMFRGIGSVGIMATTPIRSLSEIMTIGACMIRRTAITGYMTMIAATPFSPRSPQAPLLASSSAPWQTDHPGRVHLAPKEHPLRARGGCFPGHRSIFSVASLTFIFH